jgi:hypothetical protein
VNATEEESQLICSGETLQEILTIKMQQGDFQYIENLLSSINIVDDDPDQLILCLHDGFDESLEFYKLALKMIRVFGVTDEGLKEIIDMFSDTEEFDKILFNIDKEIMNRIKNLLSND